MSTVSVSNSFDQYNLPRQSKEWYESSLPSVNQWKFHKDVSSNTGSVLEGVFEQLPWGHIIASVQTDKGHRLWEVRDKTRFYFDPQSGQFDCWKIVLDEAGNAIRAAYDQLVPQEAIKIVSAIWEQLDRTGELAAARSRLLLGKLSKPILGALPEWFEKQKQKLSESDEDEITADSCAVSSAELLVRAAVAAYPQANDFGAELETGPRGRVVIDWYMPKGRLQWMVEALAAR